MQVWKQEKNIAGNKQVVSFKGGNVDNLHINFKKSGDWLQEDSIWDDRYFLFFYFCNDTTP